VCHIFRTGRPTNFELGTQMKHDDPYAPTSAMGSEVKGQGRKVTYVVRLSVGLAHKSTTKSTQNVKIVKKVAHFTGNNAHRTGSRSKGQRLMSPGRLMLKPKVSPIIRTSKNW